MTVADAEDSTGLTVRIRKRLHSNLLILLIPKEQSLVRSVTIPGNVEPRRHIESILEEVSPLPANQLYSDSTTDGNALTLAIARKPWVDRQLGELGDMGIEVNGATVEGFEDTPLNLLPGSRHHATNADVSGLMLLVSGALLCTVGFYFVAQQQYDTLGTIETNQRLLQNKIDSGQTARDEIDFLQARVSAIAQRRLNQPSPLSLLADVTQSIPDHTWVRNWMLEGDALTLLGETTDTADLISGLEASPLLSDVHYESAITRDPGNNRERYRISATVGPR